LHCNWHNHRTTAARWISGRHLSCLRGLN